MIFLNFNGPQPVRRGSINSKKLSGSSHIGVSRLLKTVYLGNRCITQRFRRGLISKRGHCFHNEIADALSRRPEVEEETEKEIPPESDDDEWIAVSYQVEEQGGRISSMEFNQVISELVGGPKLTKNLKIAYRLRMSQRKS